MEAARADKGRERRRMRNGKEQGKRKIGIRAVDMERERWQGADRGDYLAR